MGFCCTSAVRDIKLKGQMLSLAKLCPWSVELSDMLASDLQCAPDLYIALHRCDIQECADSHTACCQLLSTHAASHLYHPAQVPCNAVLLIFQWNNILVRHFFGVIQKMNCMICIIILVIKNMTNPYYSKIK